MRHLDRRDVLAVGAQVLGRQVEVLDWGLVEAALSRAAAVVYGRPAYRDEFEMAAALAASLVCDRAFLDGNKRIGLASAVVFLLKNGVELDLPEDASYDFVMQIAEGPPHEIPDLAAALRGWAKAHSH